MSAHRRLLLVAALVVVAAVANVPELDGNPAPLAPSCNSLGDLQSMFGGVPPMVWVTDASNQYPADRVEHAPDSAGFTAPGIEDVGNWRKFATPGTTPSAWYTVDVSINPTDRIDRETIAGNESITICAFVNVATAASEQLLADTTITQVAGNAQNGGSRAIGFAHEDCIGGDPLNSCTTQHWVVQNGENERLVEQPIIVGQWEYLCGAWSDSRADDVSMRQMTTALLGRGAPELNGTSGMHYTGSAPVVHRNGNNFITVGATHYKVGVEFMPFVGLDGTVDNLVVVPKHLSQDEMLAYRNCWDADGDGVRNDVDLCPGVYDPTNANNDSDSLGDACDNCVFVGNDEQGDVDSDGLGDLCDNCPAVNNPAQTDDNSNGQGDACENQCVDVDSDGFCTNLEPIDNCPLVPNDQQDQDGDAIGDACDGCANAFNPSQADTDSDGVQDACDNCPDADNADQENADLDRFGDACDNCPTWTNGAQWDLDSDGVGTECDNCEYPGGPLAYNPQQVDQDSDGFGDACDNCPEDHNDEQTDTNSNGIGDECDPCLDEDSDAVCDDSDNCLGVSNSDQSDRDIDGLGDPCDACPDTPSVNVDTDSDSIGDACDQCPTTFCEILTDVNSDGQGTFASATACNEDTDEDTHADHCDNCVLVKNEDQADANSDGEGDACELGSLTVASVCDKVWLVSNTYNDNIDVLWDWRPSYGKLRFQATVPAGESIHIVMTAHGASREVLHLQALRLPAQTASALSVPQRFPNEHRGQACVEVTPVCRGRYALINRYSPTPIEVAWRTPVYAYDPEKLFAAHYTYGVMLPHDTWVLVSTLGVHNRERLEVYLANTQPRVSSDTDEGEESALVRKEGVFVGKYAVQCDITNTADKDTLVGAEFPTGDHNGYLGNAGMPAGSVDHPN